MKLINGLKGKVVVLKKDDVPSVAKVAAMMLAHGESNWEVYVDCGGVQKPVEGLVFDAETGRIIILNEDS